MSLSPAVPDVQAILWCNDLVYILDQGKRPYCGLIERLNNLKAMTWQTQIQHVG